MQILLQGILRDGYGHPLPGASIVFSARRTTDVVLAHTDARDKTDSLGRYAIRVEPGYYDLHIAGRKYINGILVNDQLTSGDLNELILQGHTDDQADDLIVEFREIQTEINAALDEAYQRVADSAELNSARDTAVSAASQAQQAASSAVDDAEVLLSGYVDSARNEADRANTYADNAGYVTRQRLLEQATLNLNFARGKYLVDDGEMTETTNASDVLSVVRSTPKWVMGPNGKLREVPPNTVAREWDPVTGKPLGALIEDESTNYFTGSQSFTSWGLTDGADLIEMQAELPDGSVGTVSLLDVSAASSARASRKPPDTAVDQTCTYSVFVRAMPGESGIWSVTSRNLTTGEDVITQAAVDDTRWHRIPVSREAEDGNIAVYPAYRKTGQTLMRALTAWSQFEPGELSSYIPTEDAPVTRAADQVSRVLGGEFNAGQGSIVCTFEWPHDLPVGRNTVLSLNDTTSDNRIRIYRQDGDLFIAYRSEGAGLFYNTAVPAIAGRYKVAVSFTYGEFRWAVNGAGGFVPADLPIGMNNLDIGQSAMGVEHLNGLLVSSDYIPRALSATELEAMTA